MGKSDWAHYPLLRTDTGSARRRERESESLFLQLIVNGHQHQGCHYQECMAICQGSPYLTWLPPPCLCAVETNERRLPSPCPGAVRGGGDGRSGPRLLACIVSSTRPAGE